MLPYRSQDGFVVVPLAPFGAPVWKPFLNFRGISFIDRIRPVPIVFLLFAFMPQLSAIFVLDIIFWERSNFEEEEYWI